MRDERGKRTKKTYILHFLSIPFSSIPAYDDHEKDFLALNMPLAYTIDDTAKMFQKIDLKAAILGNFVKKACFSQMIDAKARFE